MLSFQTQDKKVEPGDTDVAVETSGDALDCSSNSRSGRGGAEGGGLSAEQPFIKLSQEEYGEHHSSIMHCRSAIECTIYWFRLEPGRRALVILAGSINDIIQWFIVVILFCEVLLVGEKRATVEVHIAGKEKVMLYS